MGGCPQGPSFAPLYRLSCLFQVSPSLLPGKVSFWVGKIEVRVVQISLAQQTSSGLLSSHQGERGATISFH